MALKRPSRPGASASQTEKLSLLASSAVLGPMQAALGRRSVQRAKALAPEGLKKAATWALSKRATSSGERALSRVA